MLWDFNTFLQTCLITFCTMACVHSFLYANKAIPKDIRNLFLGLTNVLVIECLEDYFDKRLYLVSYESVAVLRIIVSVVGYTIRPLMLYLVMLIMTRSAKWKGRKIVLAIPTIITFAVSMLAFFTDWVFWYDSDNGFHSGPLRFVIFGMLVVYFVMILASAIIRFKRRGGETLVIFGIILLLAFDWILVLVLDDTRLHLTLEALSVILYFMYFLSIFNAKKMEENEAERIEAERLLTKTMLDQSIETLAYTIDAKDRYTKGHSSRVAKYARMIAMVLGKSEEECREVYLAGLLHDIGKISVRGQIINKPGELTEDEFDIIKKHPSNGARILNKMKSIPYLRDGALYHHERYDGTGYPTGLKGEEIPAIARIISVADAYDAMTSCRSYRPIMDQSVVKQEIWKGIGTQFDPLYAKVMISLIDADVDYKMHEVVGEQDEIIFDDVDTKIEWPSAPKGQHADITMLQDTDANTLAAFIVTEDHWCAPAEGFEATNNRKRISFHSTTRKEASYLWSAPVVLVYSSDDGEVVGPNYDELGVFMSAGYSWKAGSTSLGEYSDFSKQEDFVSWENWISRNKAGLDYTLDVQMVNNKVSLTIDNELLRVDGWLTVPEKYTKKVYVAVAGERSDISDISLLEL